MKKLLLLLPFVTFLLTGCNPKEENKVTDTPKESIQLSASNYINYVAINTSIATPNPNYADVIYYSYFIGADYCKFVDCKLTYKYVLNGGTAESATETIALTLSGDGQANPFYARSQNRGNYYNIVITGASGTVQIYR